MINKPGRNCPATRETTKKQGERLDAALEEIELLTHSMDEIEGKMPHLDGTPLEQEPCVKALRKLIEDLDQIKVDSAAQMVVLREKAEYQQKDASLGEELVQAVKGGGGSRERSIDAVDEVLKRRMSEFEIIDADLGALHNRSLTLISQVDVQKKLFDKATAKAKSYGARQEYFKKLLHGAEELVELHAGLKEGCNFYGKILNQLRRAMQEASQISDQRREERDRLLAASRFGQNNNNNSGGWWGGGGSTSQPAPQQPMPRAQPAQPMPRAQPVQAQPMPRAQPVQAQPMPRAQPTGPPQKIACCYCGKHFGIPPNTAIVACPHCKGHNRVPGR